MGSIAEFPNAPQPSADEAVATRLQLLKPARGITAAAFRRVTVACEIAADLTTIILAIRLGCLMYTSANIGHIQFSSRLIWAASLICAGVMALMLDRAGAYSKGNSLMRVRETEQVLKVSAAAIVAAVAVDLFAHISVPRGLLLLCFSIVPLALFAEKALMYWLVDALHSRGYGNERVLIYGAGPIGRRVFSLISGSPKLGLLPIALADDDPKKSGRTLFEMSYERRRSTRIVQGPVTRELLLAHGIDLLIIAIPAIGRKRFMHTVDEALAVGVRVSFVSGDSLSSDWWIDYRDVDGILLASLGKPARRFGYDVIKRLFDYVVSLCLLVLGAPVFLTLAVLIKLDSRGPVLFRQQRIGQGGRGFGMYKFRTMRTTSHPYALSPRESSDPRITPIGRFLRRSSLDELPQLINVLRGEMSLVGPRPEMPFIVERYNAHHRRRLEVKPGLTGLWQLSGDRRFMIHENIEYDLYYIQNRNFFMDLAVLLHTSLFAMRGI